MKHAWMIVGAWAVSSLAQAAPEALPKSRATMPSVQQVVAPQHRIEFTSPPLRQAADGLQYSVVLGWGQAVALSANQTGPASVELDYMHLMEQDPATGRITAVDGGGLEFDHPLRLRSEAELFNRFCPDGTPGCSFPDSTFTVPVPSTSNGDVVAINVGELPTKIPRWWTPRTPIKAGTRYYVEARFRVTGQAAVQFGSDWWVNSPEFTVYDATCRQSNNCEAWVSDWYGDTHGDFVTILAPVGMPNTNPAAQMPVALEYHHTDFDHYFATILADEITKLDASVFSGWDRTGQSFKVYPRDAPLAINMCRFFSTSFGSKSSHFYTPFESECRLVQRDPNWTFEGEVFGVGVVSANGVCPTGTTALYRLYNNGHGGAPNHRYTTDPTERQRMLGQDWVPEGRGVGVIACVPE